jgi:hypothetical protein
LYTNNDFFNKDFMDFPMTEREERALNFIEEYDECTDND